MAFQHGEITNLDRGPATACAHTAEHGVSNLFEHGTWRVARRMAFSPAAQRHGSNTCNTLQAMRSETENRSIIATCLAKI
jgi:hypothetical protein